MTSPKDTLGRLASSEGFKSIGMIPNDMLGMELKARMEYAAAAIPVAELEGQAVELLRKRVSLNWIYKRNALLTKLDALK